MQINKIVLQNFRNIAYAELKPCADVNIVYGDNAQGKTNLIEALWLTTGAKSFRGARDADFIRFGENFSRTEVFFEKDARVQTALIVYAQKKKAELNEIVLPSVTGFSGIFCAVVFSPAHLGLIQDGPGERRRFVDTCLCQLSPRYISLTTEYARVLLQRNSLLKDISYSSALLDTLDIWDEKLVSLACLVVQQRSRYLEQMDLYAREIYHDISSQKESFQMKYLISGNEQNDKMYREWFALALKQNRAEDIRMGATTIGPHRDDIDITIENKSVRSFGSQGQQRSAVLALKLAESKMIQEVLHDTPVILLDDVMSELDKGRQEYVLNHLKENQVFLTCCDKTNFERLRGGKAFFMREGALGEAKTM